MFKSRQGEIKTTRATSGQVIVQAIDSEVDVDLISALFRPKVNLKSLRLREPKIFQFKFDLKVFMWIGFQSNVVN